MKTKIKIAISFILLAIFVSGCLTHEQSVTKNAQKKYKNFKQADCGCH